MIQKIGQTNNGKIREDNGRQQDVRIECIVNFGYGKISHQMRFDVKQFEDADRKRPKQEDEKKWKESRHTHTHTHNETEESG